MWNRALASMRQTEALVLVIFVLFGLCNLFKGSKTPLANKENLTTALYK